MCRLDFGVKRSKIKVTARNDPKTLVNNISHKPREFHPILVTDVFGSIDVLIRFWSQKDKGQGHSTQ